MTIFLHHEKIISLYLKNDLLFCKLVTLIY